jgi:uncharacterized UBP type Zn finger protein
VACTHIPDDLAPPVVLTPDVCGDCAAAGRHDWVHLRLCQACGHVGCCDNSPGRHATAHFSASQHPIIRSYEPGEDWWWCYVDDDAYFIDAAPSSPSHR